MPVRLEFEDRSGRLHFERTMREKCGLKASMSLPLGLRVAQKAATAAVKRNYLVMVAMVRPDVDSLSFVALVKRDSEKKWNTLPNKMSIDTDCLSWTDSAATAAMGAVGGLGTGRLKEKMAQKTRIHKYTVASYNSERTVTDKLN